MKGSYPPGRGLLAGKTVLVTAAAGTGIGFATAKRAVEEGARVVVSDIHERRLREAAEQLGAGAHAALGNVAVEEDVQRLVAEAVDFGGGQLDVLVNNAGLGGTATLAEITDEQWFAVLDVTLTNDAHDAQPCHMGARGSGDVNNARSSAGARSPARRTTAAKAGDGVDRCAEVRRRPWACERRRFTPRCTSIAKVTSDELLAELATREAFGRAAEPREVANVIVFLASDLASYMTGEVVSVSSQHP